MEYGWHRNVTFTLSDLAVIASKTVCIKNRTLTNFHEEDMNTYPTNNLDSSQSVSRLPTLVLQGRPNFIKSQPDRCGGRNLDFPHKIWPHSSHRTILEVLRVRNYITSTLMANASVIALRQPDSYIFRDTAKWKPSYASKYSAFLAARRGGFKQT